MPYREPTKKPKAPKKRKKRKPKPKLEACCLVDKTSTETKVAKNGQRYRLTPTGKHPGGRPTKMTRKLLDALLTLDNIYMTYFSNEEIFELWMNQVEDPKDRISKDTYNEWISNGLRGKHNLQMRNALDEFSQIIKKAQATEKRNLLKILQKPEDEITGSNKVWQSRAWLLERKWNDMRQRNHIDVTTSGDKIQAPQIYLPTNGNEAK